MKFSKLRDYPLMETSMFVLMSYSTFILAELAQLTGMHYVGDAIVDNRGGRI